MDNVGAEVGQKMRSAIKAKLMELGCYVDDELPDYVMVMVANKRSKAQMNEDLQLFLTTKTEAFVEWLQIVLKKLKEVTVTNPDIYKHSFVQESLKRKCTTLSETPIKKEKKEKNLSRKTKHITEAVVKDVASPVKSLTDDLPMKATNLAEKRIQNNRTVVLDKRNQTTNEGCINISRTVDKFDIPTLSEVKNLDENNLVLMQKRLEKVRKRVVMMNSDSEDEDFINIKAENDDLFGAENASRRDTLDQPINVHIINDDTDDIIPRKPMVTRKIKLVRETSTEYPKQLLTMPLHSKGSLVNCSSESVLKLVSQPLPKKSVMERLGKRADQIDDRAVKVTQSDREGLKKTKISLTEALREERELLRTSLASKKKEASGMDRKSRENTDHKPKKERISVLKRLGVRSTIARPSKQKAEQDNIEEIHEKEMKPKSLASMVKIKPRNVMPIERQANKNLLLKAVAEAQKSIVQTKISESHKKKQLMSEGLQTKKYKAKVQKAEVSVDASKSSKISNATNNNNVNNKRIPNAEISKLKKIVIEIATNDEKQRKADKADENSLEYIPKPVAEEVCSPGERTYVPSTIDSSYDDYDSFNDDETSDFGAADKNVNKQQRFIVTLDGFTENKRAKSVADTASFSIRDSSAADSNNAASRRSPIVFQNDSVDSDGNELKDRSFSVPSVLPKVHGLSALKLKERCKYYPGCRLGDKCEYVHPSSACKMFPHCKFGDKCLYIHPICKFDASCTRRDCPYNHGANKTTSVVTRPPVPSTSQSTQICKYFPNCSNSHCNYHHPRACRFGKFCTKEDCNYAHEHKVKGSLTWQRT